MKLEDYFEFQSNGDIRIKGSRVGIESVLYGYVYRNQSAEQIAEDLPNLKTEQIYATILYFLNNRKAVEKYLLDWMSFGKRMRKTQAKNPPPVVLKLRRQIKKRKPVAA